MLNRMLLRQGTMSSKKKSCYASSSFWIYVVFVLGLLFLELTHCMFDKNEESENRFLRRQLLEEDTVASPSLSPRVEDYRDLFLTDPPSTDAQQDNVEYEGSTPDETISATDAIPVVMVGVASGVIMCAVLLYFTDMRDRCKHERLMEERRQERREANNLKQPETLVSTTLHASSPSRMRTSVPSHSNPAYVVEKVSGDSTISTMSDPTYICSPVEPTSSPNSAPTSRPTLDSFSMSDLDNDLDDSLQVTELKDSHRVLQGTDLSSLVDLSKIPAIAGLAKAARGDASSFKSLQGDCAASQIGSVMDSASDDDESLCSSRSPGDSFEPSKESVCMEDSVSGGASFADSSPPDESTGQQELQSLSLAIDESSDRSLSAPPHAIDNTGSALEFVQIAPASSSVKSPTRTSSISETLTSPTKSMGSSLNSMHSAQEPPSSPPNECENCIVVRTGTAPEECSSTSTPTASPIKKEATALDLLSIPCSTLERSPDSIKLSGEQHYLEHSLERSPDTPIIGARDELAQLRQIYAANYPEAPLEEDTGNTGIPIKNLLEDIKNHDDDEEPGQDYIRHVYFVPVTKNSVNLGISFDDASNTRVYPSVKAIYDESPLLDRLFVGDFILAVNNIDTLGISSASVTNLLCQQDDMESQCSSKETGGETRTNDVVKLTIMSSQSDGSDSESDYKHSAERSEPTSEV